MVFHVQGRGRSGGPDLRLGPGRRRAVVRRKKGGTWMM